MEFSARTFVTEGMAGLLEQSLRRVSSKDGEPVIQLKIAFGGGKMPKANVAVLVGTALDPTKSKRPNNMPSITINTLWGEMAAQLAESAGNPKLYEYVKESDKKGVSPGSEALKNLFDAASQ